jgi:hypothetical protein
MRCSALGPSTRCTLTLAAALAVPRPGAADALWEAELRAGYGISVGGAGEQMSARATPLTIEASVSFAFNEDPPLAGYGGFTVETLDRNAVGAVGGVILTPHDSHLRLAAGGVYLFAPYTLWGASASLGLCFHVASRTKLCGALEATAYFAGSDLPEGRTVTDGKLVLGLGFDAL